MSWLGRAGARLLPAERRDWAEAVWAEAHAVPPGWPRLAWRAGGVWLIAREAKMVRWIGSRLVFAAAAGAAAWAAWPAGDAAMVRADVIATVLLLAGLPLLGRRFLGPPANRAARRLRACGYAAVLALMPAKAVLELFLGAVPRGGIDLHTYDVFQCPNAMPGQGPVVNCLVPGTSTGGPAAGSEVMLLLLTACGLAVLLALTARRAPMAPATLATGAGAGLALGAATYALAPLGLNVAYPDRPWLHGGAVDPFVALFWIFLFGAPLVAGAVAGWRCHVPADAGQASAARCWQGLGAGLVSGGVGASFVTVLGTGTTALLVKSARVRGLLYHGQHLTSSAVYGRELFACQDVGAYFLLLVGFPIIGALLALTGAGIANATRRPLPDGGGPGGLPGPEPVPVPPDGGRRADAAAGQDRPLALYDGEREGDQVPPGLVGAWLERAR
jgi:hypothetical protein